MKKIITSILIITSIIIVIKFISSKEIGEAVDESTLIVNETGKQQRPSTRPGSTDNQRRQVEQTEAESEKSHNHSDTNKTIEDIEKFIIKVEDNKETRSLRSSIDLISKIDYNNVDLIDLKRQYEDRGIEVDISADSNKHTGNMYILKSTKPIAGMRYFHNQIFEEENENKFIQHLSFEYKKGKSSFQEVITLVHQAYKDDLKLEILNENYALWRRADNRIITIKRLNLSDIKSDIINPHDTSDIGTIRLTIEQEIH